jgi:hypothetical protein
VYDACFGLAAPSGAPLIAERVKMNRLIARDLVLSTPHQMARVIVKQHAEVPKFSEMLNIKYAGGSIELTPDHVLLVNGRPLPAREVLPGSHIGDAVVLSVSTTAAPIINAPTTTGFILAGDSEGGAPVVASHTTELIAPYALSPPDSR